jgi:beta-lactamase class A
MISRRGLMIAAGCAAWLATSRTHAYKARTFDEPAFDQAIAALEAESGGRLGVAVLDTGSGQRFARRGDERFAMCSTFKFLLAAAILSEVDQGRERLDRGVPVTAGDIISHSPVTERFVGREASVAELCEAAITVSDNGAANLLLAMIGGPQGLTRFARGIGDEVTRLDRTETDLNEAAPGDPRDTTSPNAMLADLDRLVLGSVLMEASRERLAGWLVANRTGDARLRAGLPDGWRVGDKTGTGKNGTANDIAVLWPPDGAAILVTSYLTGCPLEADARNAVHAGVARAIAAALAA